MNGRTISTVVIATMVLALASGAQAAVTLTGNSSSVSNTGLIPLAGAPFGGAKADNTQVGPSL